MYPPAQKQVAYWATVWVQEFEEFCRKGNVEDAGTSEKIVAHFLSLPALVMSHGPLIASISPPVERTFMKLVPEPSPLHADVLQALLLLRSKRAEWVKNRRARADSSYSKLAEQLRL